MRIITIASLILLAGCMPDRSNTTVSTGPVAAPSGVTANNGGGQRQLGDVPSVGVTNGRATVGGAPNGRGNSY